jgi:hypothetical protein
MIININVFLNEDIYGSFEDLTASIFWGKPWYLSTYIAWDPKRP